MKHTLLPAVLLLAALLAGGAWSQERGHAQDLEQRVATLEGDLARAQRALAEVQAHQHRVESYLAAQAGAAQAMHAVLDEVEKKGFTAGINPDSRVALLAGMRALFESAQRQVPGRPVVDER